MFTRHEIELADCFDVLNYDNSELLPKSLQDKRTDRTSLGVVARKLNKLEAENEPSEEDMRQARIAKYRQQVESGQEIQFDVNESLFYKRARNFLTQYGKLDESFDFHAE